MSRLPARRPLLRGLAALVPLVLLTALAPAWTSARPAAPARADDLAPLFTPLRDFELQARDADGDRATVRPTSFAAFRVDPDEARSALTAAPIARSGAVEIAIPDPSGEVVTFAVVERSVMEPGLQAAHPEIRTYAGQAVDGSGRSVALGVTRLGFSASVRSPEGGASWYVDPAYRESAATDYLSYYGAAVPADSDVLVERGPVDTEEILAAAPAEAQRPAAGAPVTKRTYRLAFVTDPTYARYFGTQNVLSAKAALLLRTNQIYNDDLAIEFVLAEGTDRLDLDTVEEASGPDGPCGASACYDAAVYSGASPTGCDGALLDRTEFVLGQLVGADSYDIGHIGLGVNGGGIAGLGVVGGGSKSSGCTGLPAPTGDFYAVDYFSHEIGHQMGGNHTFNGDQINCSATNRNGGGVPVLLEGTTVEPGSGSTVMAYAGICGQDNLQPHSDPYFSQRSIDEIDAVVTADPGTVSEVQTVTFTDPFVAGDSLVLSYDGRTSPPIQRGLGYDLGASVLTAVQDLTGCLPSVAGYDGAATPDEDGFSVAFDNDCAGEEIKRLGIATTSTGVAGFVGVQDDGGEETNQGRTSASGNAAPRVVAPADKTIPRQTPFTLSGSATDTDGDPLSYLWEQNSDAGATGTSLVDNTKRDGPLFRVFGTYADVTPEGTLTTPSPGINLATASGTRTFPDLAQVLAGNTNAKTGACPTAPAIPTPATGRSNVPVPIVECFAEFLPTGDYGDDVRGRTLDFRLTARDGAAEGGGTQFDDVRLTVDATAGPFLVTSRGTAGTVAAPGSTEPVTWSVAGTDTPALAPNVRISISTDGGATFTTLVASTPNDGSESVTLPTTRTNDARIRVEAVGNYFFDVNDAPFTIATVPAGAPGDPGTVPTNPTTALPTAALATRTRIRLPRVQQVRGRESIPLRYAVVSSSPSAGSAGRVVIRVDGRTVSTRTVPVVRKQGKQVVGGTYRLPRDLALGGHRISIRFTPADRSTYRSSRSRTITLTVVRSR